MDIPGFTPTRRVVATPYGFTVYVKPPLIVGTLPEVSVFLTPAQYARYQQWRNGPLQIQDALPELSVSEREMLMSGLADADFHRIASDWDE